MFKKIVVSLLAVMMIAAPVHTVCFAAEPETGILEGVDVSPRYVNIRTFGSALSISSSVASCSVDYQLINPSYTAKCQIYLEYSDDQSNWHYVTSWTENGSDEESYEKERKLGFTQTHYYHVRSVLTVYNTSGKQVEKVEATSNIVEW